MSYKISGSLCVSFMAVVLVCGCSTTPDDLGLDGFTGGGTGGAAGAGYEGEYGGYGGSAGTYTAPLAGGTGGSGGSVTGGAGGSVIGGSGGEVTGGSGGSVTGGTGGSVTGGSGGGVTGGTGGSAAGTGGTGGSGGSTASGKPPCITSPNEVVMVGDSYMIWSSHSFQTDMAAQAGENWRFYAVAGASMASGGVQPVFIPGQFELAVAADPNIKFVLMDGGGNDILIPAATWIGGADCKNNPDAANIQVCRDIIDLALSESVKGMDRMVEVGVKDVVYFFYPKVPEGTPLGGLYPNAMLDYALPLARDLCESAETRTNGQLRCHFIDMIPVFEACQAAYPVDGCFALNGGDIHENFNGSAAMAEAIWQRMTDECLAQYASSGCCEP
jgi:hypothetical protein